MHAKLLVDLDRWGFVNYYHDIPGNVGHGTPNLSSLCAINSQGVLGVDFSLFTTINEADMNEACRFAVAWCNWYAVHGQNASNLEWWHEIFGVEYMELPTFQQFLEDYLYQYLQTETASYQNYLSQEENFGSDWQEEVAEFYSWMGLERTREFMNNYAIDYFGLNPTEYESPLTLDNIDAISFEIGNEMEIKSVKIESTNNNANTNCYED